jgi:hypothetical protein
MLSVVRTVVFWLALNDAIGKIGFTMDALAGLLSSDEIGNFGTMAAASARFCRPFPFGYR